MIENEYNSSFVAIPLPQEYLPEFGSLLADVRKIDIWLRLASLQRPHITLYYLGKQDEETLKKAGEKIQPRLQEIKGLELTIGGFGYFNINKIPSIFYLKVSYPEPLRRFRKSIISDLEEFYPDKKNLTFSPHVTVAKLDPRDPRLSRKITHQLEERFAKVEWKIEVNEIGVYGQNFELNDIIPEDFRISDE